MSILNLQISASSSLTSTQRWDALRVLNSNFWAREEFIIVCGIILAALVMIFVIVTLLDTIKRKRNSNRLFIEYADKRGLNIRERQILMDIALKARLRFAETIFTMSDVFDRGATQMVRVTLSSYGARRSRYLSAELTMLREKMGFRKRTSFTEMANSKDLEGSRQIFNGKKIYLTNPESLEFFEIESTVIENTSLGLKIQLQEMIECEPGDAFCVRYYFGSVIWEFDSYVLNTQGDILILQHNDKIRYVNRRRFLRVNVNEPAYIAAFPFTQNISEEIKNKRKTDIESELWGSIWEPPKFIAADLVELAGPGLKLISPIDVKIGDRVIVILKLSHLKNKIDDTIHSKIIEDIGIVKHVEEIEKGNSIAIELNYLTEKNISEMVKVTNEASLNKKRIKELPSEQKEKSRKYEYISETIIN